ncbi:MAG: NAD(P)/FAD-dependent oxidoreductase [Alistipes sp.]
MSKYDVIIIGSGLGGLACGAILSKEGERICVVEKEPIAGGCLRSFRRDGVLFDTGMHYIGSMDDGEILNHFLRYCGVYDSLRLQRLDDDGFDVIHTEGREFRFCQGYTRFVDSLAEAFPASRQQINNYAASLQQAGQSIGVEKLRQGIVSSDGLRFMSMAASAQIEQQIDDPLLRKVVAGTSFLYDGVRDRSPFYQHAMIQHSFIHGAYRFTNGSQQLADALVDVIRCNGGEVRCGNAVTRVCQQNNCIRGVEFASGEILEAGRVISDIHPAQLLPMLTPCPRIRPSFQTRVDSVANTFGVFSFFASVDKQAFPYRNQNHYIVGSGDVWADSITTQRPQTIMLSMQAHSSNDACEAISLLCPMQFSEVEKWAETSVGKRGAEYCEFKQRKAEEVIQIVEHQFQGFRAAIRSIHTATPLTYRDYTGTPHGTAYGTAIDCNNVMGTLFSPATKVEGLYLTGQNIATHGALGVVMTAIATCGAILGSEYIARKIGGI